MRSEERVTQNIVKTSKNLISDEENLGDGDSRVSNSKIV